MNSLHEVSIENYLRVVSATINFMKKGEAYFLESALNPDDIVDFKLAPDMLPFSFQV